MNQSQGWFGDLNDIIDLGGPLIQISSTPQCPGQSGLSRSHFSCLDRCDITTITMDCKLFFLHLAAYVNSMCLCFQSLLFNM